jgi:thiamine transport system ATP-binding protein
VLDIEKVGVTYGRVTAVRNVDLHLADGRVLALLGPSGCGKSTLLRAVAGLEPLSAGRITWDGADLAGVPVHRRRFGLMFQDGVLFPHRSVGGNVGYGLAGSVHGRTVIGARVAELLELVGLPGYADRPVGTLSGGEAQRVALARSLAPGPRLLLLDEPLAALDRALRERLLADLRRVLTTTGTTALFVTHDQGEAFAVADEVAVMNDGVIRQVGEPDAVWRAPADEWVARFLGYSSVLPGEPRAGDSTRCAVGVVPGRGAAVALRPAALRLDPAGELAGTCLSVEPGPDVTRLTVDLPGVGEIAATADGGRPTAGQLVRLRFDPMAAAVLPAPSSPDAPCPDASSPDASSPAPSSADPSGTLDR